MAVYIPGGDTLGYTFNVFGTYNDRSKILPLFEMKYGEETYKDYLVPSGASLNTAIAGGSADLKVFTSRKQVEESFSQKAGISAGYGFFSAEFEAAFNTSEKSDISYDYAKYESDYKQYSLTLKNASEANLAPWVKDDEDYKNVPDEFDEETRELFFRFFQKYGMYFVSSVIVGSRLYYCAAVSKSEHFSEKEIKIKFSMEVNAVFSAKASSETEWKKVGREWSTNRTVKINATGGDSSILNMAVPDFGSNDEDAMKNWRKSAELNPSIVDFVLKPIDAIFSGKRAVAVRKAIKEYQAHLIFMESKTGSCAIVVDNKQVLPSPPNDAKNFGFHLAALNRSTLKVEFKRAYTSHEWWSGLEDIYNKMLEDVKPYNNDKYIILFTTYSSFARTAPNPAFAKFLKNCGADTELESWLDTKSSNSEYNKGTTSCDLVHNNYLMVGIPGSDVGTAQEKYTRTGSCDTGAMHWSPSGGNWLNPAAPPISMTVDLYLIKNEKGNSKGLAAHIPLPKAYRAGLKAKKAATR